LAFGRLPGQPLTIIGERNNGGRGAHALGIFNHSRRRAFHDGDAGIGRAKVDTDDLTHRLSSLSGRPAEPYERSEGSFGRSRHDL